MPNFADLLDCAVQARKNPVCVGLDPRFDALPRAIQEAALREHGTTARAAAEAFLAFNRAILDAVADLVPVCKPQIAFYEEYGPPGLEAYQRTIAYAKQKGLVVISDAKRGDIGTTAVAYARAHFNLPEPAPQGKTLPPANGFAADALTVNPYLGLDTLQPYLQIGHPAGKGIFVLVKTSNPGSGELQDLPVEGHPFHERLAERLAILGRGYLGNCGYSSVGAVVGATYPAQARRLRQLMPQTIFLIPGYGAQGATAADAAAGFGPDGRGAVVNASRGILFAFQKEPYASRFGESGFAEAARAAALEMAEDLRRALEAQAG